MLVRWTLTLSLRERGLDLERETALDQARHTLVVEEARLALLDLLHIGVGEPALVGGLGLTPGELLQTVPAATRVRGMAVGGVLDPRPVVRVEQRRDGDAAACRFVNTVGAYAPVPGRDARAQVEAS